MGFRNENNQLYYLTYNSRSYAPYNLYRINSATKSIETPSDIYGQLPTGVRLNTFFNSLPVYLQNFISYKGLFYFSAGSESDYELWRSDGTLIKRIQTSQGLPSDPQSFYIHNGLLYFTAYNNDVCRELYVTDGTTAGTQLVADLNPGPESSSPRSFFTFNNELYFTTNTSKGGGLYKLSNSTAITPPTNLTLTQPTYDCNSGQLTFSATGGNGSPIEYRIAGVRDWSTSNSFTIPTVFRNGTTLNLDARQNGVVVSIPFLTACQTTPPTPPTGTGLTLPQPTYDCNSGQLVLNATGGNGQLVEYRVAGLRDWASSNTFSVPTYQRSGTIFTLEARQSGVVVSLPFTAVCQVTPPMPPASQPLTVSSTVVNCLNGSIQLVAAGGDGTPIEYKVPGLRDYSPSSLFTVPTYQRSNTTFTLYARQSGREVTGTYTATCPVNARVASTEAAAPFEVVVYPNPVGEQFSVGVSGATGQTIRFRISTLNGQTVVEQRAVAESDAHTETLKLPASGAGLYLLQVSTDTQTKTLKVLKP